MNRSPRRETGAGCGYVVYQHLGEGREQHPPTADGDWQRRADLDSVLAQ